MAGKPCLEHAVRLLKRHGVEDIVVNLHYLPEQVTDYFGDGSRFGVRLTYSYEEELLGTAGGFKKVEEFFGGGTALIVSGDALTDIDLGDFYRFHREQGALATLALKKVADPTRYGVVVTDGARVVRFQEKPKREEAVSLLANTGIYLFEPEIFREIPAGVFYDFGRQVFYDLLRQGNPPGGFELNGYWCDVGDLAVYREAHRDILKGRVRLDLPAEQGDLRTGRNVVIHKKAALTGPVLLGDGVTVEEGATIAGPAFLGAGTCVGKKAVIEEGILWNNVVVEEGARLNGTIVADGCRVPAGVVCGQVVLEPVTLQQVLEAAAAKEELR
jgi:NDP-sugar pyrophosphorylase family protein